MSSRQMPQPTRGRNFWTKEEDCILERETNIQLDQGSLKDWNSIATRLPGRSNKDCRKRWTKLSKQINKGAWDGTEDETLREAVQQEGLRWTVVAKVVGTRSADQCAKRWQHFLDPAIDHSEWHSSDDQRLLHAVTVYGRNWKLISDKEFPRRSPTDLKNRFVAAERRRRQSAAASSATSATSESTSPLSYIPSTNSDDMEQELDSNFGDYGHFKDLKMVGLEPLGSVPRSSHVRSAMSVQDQEYTWPDFGRLAEDYDQDRATLSSAHSHIDLINGHDSATNWNEEMSFDIPEFDMSDTNTLSQGQFTPHSSTGRKSRSTLILEDLEPDAVNEILQLMFQKKIKMKMRLQSQDD